MTGRLRLGLPSKGRIQTQTIDWLAERGMTVRMTGADREYVGAIEGVADVDLVLLSAGEIPRELAAGRIHLGVTGVDLVREKVADWESRIATDHPLGFAHADVVLAAPEAWADVETTGDLDDVAARFRARHGQPLRIATKFHTLTRAFLAEKGVGDYRLVDSQGATEGVVVNDLAEAIVDITSTGATLRANRLKILRDGLILKSQACLCRSLTAEMNSAQNSALLEFERRIGVQAVETTVGTE